MLKCSPCGYLHDRRYWSACLPLLGTGLSNILWHHYHNRNVCKGRCHSLLRRRSVSKNLQRPFFLCCCCCYYYYLFSIINHQVNKRPRNSLSSVSPVPIRWFNFSTAAVCAQMRLLIHRGHSWLPFYVMRFFFLKRRRRKKKLDLCCYIMGAPVNVKWLYSSDALRSCEKRQEKTAVGLGERERERNKLCIHIDVRCFGECIVQDTTHPL